MPPPVWTGVLLPDGVWYDVDAGTLEEFTFLGSISGFKFLVAGVEYRVPATSVLASRVVP
jgi:hypothetical protein